MTVRTIISASRSRNAKVTPTIIPITFGRSAFFAVAAVDICSALSVCDVVTETAFNDGEGFALVDSVCDVVKTVVIATEDVVVLAVEPVNRACFVLACQHTVNSSQFTVCCTILSNRSKNIDKRPHRRLVAPCSGV